MATLRFVPQATLDAWAEQGKVDPQMGRIIDLTSKAEFTTREAVHFVKVESGPDANGLLQKVKTLDQIKALGAEHYLTSVILGDTVYEVVPGWIADDPGGPVAAGPAARTPAAPSPAAKAGKGFDGKNREADMLAKLLLDKLS